MTDQFDIDGCMELFKEEVMLILRHTREACERVRNNKADADIYACAHRDLHTLKGTAGMMGFLELSVFAGLFNDFLHALEGGDIIADDEMFGACDKILKQVEQFCEEIEEGAPPVFNGDKIISDVRNLHAQYARE